MMYCKFFFGYLEIQYAQSLIYNMAPSYIVRDIEFLMFPHRVWSQPQALTKYTNSRLRSRGTPRSLEQDRLQHGHIYMDYIIPHPSGFAEFEATVSGVGGRSASSGFVTIGSGG